MTFEDVLTFSFFFLLCPVGTVFLGEFERGVFFVFFCVIFLLQGEANIPTHSDQAQKKEGEQQNR